MDKDSSIPLIYHDPSDLGSLILVRIIPKESTQRLVQRKSKSVFGEFIIFQIYCYLLLIN